jgi:ATP-dependent Clp protease protease subunit
MEFMESQQPETEKKPSGPDLTEKLLKTRTLTLFDEINSQTAKQFIQSLLIMEADDSKSPIKVLLNSPGGEVNSGFAIYDAIRFTDVDVKIICTGLCASIATIILTAVKKENRLSLPNCEFLIHQPLSSGITGRISDIEIASKEIVKTKEKLTSILAKETGKSLEQVKLDCDRDFWMSATAAKEYGLISKIIQSRSEI